VGQKCANVPYQEGFDSLGWQGSDIFVAPHWTRRQLELKEGPAPVVLDQFRFGGQYRFGSFPNQAAQVPHNVDFVSNDVRSLLNNLAAWLVRGSLDYKCLPVPVRDSVEARNMLKAICSVFGQVAPLQLNPSVRKCTPDKLLPGFNRLPAYTYSNNTAMLLNVDAPLWVLGGEGLKVTTAPAHQQLHTLTGMVYQLINRIVDWLVSVGPSNQINFNVTSSSQASEGQYVLERVAEHFGQDPVIEAAMLARPVPEWQEVLGGKHDKPLMGLVKFDLESGDYMLRIRQYAPNNLPVPSQTLASLCEQYGGGSVSTEDGYRVIPAAFMEEQMHFAREEPLRFNLYERKESKEKESNKPQKTASK
jgi:hypothetical protein